MNQLITTPPIGSNTNQFCHHCGYRLGINDHFCGRCGHDRGHLMEIVDAPTCTTITQTRPEPSLPLTTGNPSLDVVLNNRLAVIGIIALVGPIGLPVLWFSPRFARRTKIITTAIYVLLTTVVPILIAWYCLDVALRPIVDAFGR